MQAWMGWVVPVALLIAAVATLLVNRRRFRSQQFGTLSDRRAAPTGLVVGYAVSMTAVYLGVAIVIACVVLVTRGRGFNGTWWTFAVVGIVFLAFGLRGRSRLGKALRRARQPLD